MNDETKLISIISPCFNGAKYLPAFLESIYSQTYRPLELIFIDDGSTDDTRAVFESYRIKLQNSDITPIYVYQENSGQAAAINKGLSLFKGDYMMWVDSDDILDSLNVTKKFEYLEEHPEKGFVLCEGFKVNEADLNHPIGILARKAGESLNRIDLFRDLIMENNVVYGPGTILARRQAIIKAIPTLQIYESWQGQNWQIILPLAYCCEYGLINESLFKYVVHDNSHSHRQRKYDELIRRADGFEELLNSTICGIPGITEDEKNKWKKLVHIKYVKRKLSHAYSNKQFDDAKIYKNELKQIDKFGIEDYYIVYKFIVTASAIKHKLFNLKKR